MRCYKFFINRLLYNKRLLLLLASLFFTICTASAHPMPNSVMLLDIKGSRVDAELQLPLNELELAFGHQVNRNSNHLIERLGPQLKAYILQHIHPAGTDGKPWTVSLKDMEVQPVQQSPSGPYQELTVHLWLMPAARGNTRQFTLNYDVIIHQVVSHFVLVSVRQDWDNGLNANHPYQVGVIRLNVPTNQILPLQVNIQEGSIWRGFQNMLSLGIDHIKEGTDHLLFLLTLLLPAPLLIRNKRWSSFGGVRYSLTRILKIVTAFTAGHSLTLLIGASGWIHFPGRPIEVLIAFSIFVSAIHAFKPLFPGREMYIAAGFGLVHGMAFAETLANLNLDTGRMALSILGFNLGIELMQLFIIAITIPWLIILSRNNAYTAVRTTGAFVAAIAAIAWMIERISGQANFLSMLIQSAADEAKWIILLLAILAAASYLVQPKTQLAAR